MITIIFLNSLKLNFKYLEIAAHPLYENNRAEDPEKDLLWNCIILAGISVTDLSYLPFYVTFPLG